MHATPHDEQDAQLAVSVGPGERGPSHALLRAPPRGEHEHEHCASCLDRRDDDRDEAQVSAIVSPMRPQRTSTSPTSTEPMFAAVSLREAPKTSPPRWI